MKFVYIYAGKKGGAIILGITEAGAVKVGISPLTIGTVVEGVVVVEEAVVKAKAKEKEKRSRSTLLLPSITLQMTSGI